MRFSGLLQTAVAVCAVASPLIAQDRVYRVGPGQIVEPGFGFNLLGMDTPRAVIGVGTTSGTTSRDTLGVLVSTVRAGSPAEKAGIEEGFRIGSVNGLNLRLSPGDIGDEQMGGIMSRRLSRELDKLRPGDEVELRVYGGGQWKTMKIKTVPPDDLYASSRPAAPRRDSERATLGLNLAVTGSSRDTIGVFVMSVEDGGPAAKAGIEEGSRIASVNGVDLRGKTSRDDDEFMLRTSNISRLEREIAKAKPGDNIDLRIFYNGQYRNVKVTAGRLSDLPRRNRSFTIQGGDNLMIPRIMTPRIGAGSGGIISRDFSGDFGPAFRDMDISGEIRRSLEAARAFGRLGNRIEW
jgi:predicted metalloprotease with PDZ domain